jgi:activator of HSP90 ATPase
LKQTAVFKAAPKDVYELLMDSKKHTGFTHSPATISKKVGGKFSAWDGWIYGTNMKLMPGKLIVQKWRGDDWPKGYYSVTTFAFAKKGTGTRLTFTQKDVPMSVYSDVSKGWKKYYWEMMAEYLKK